jgi:riboflavin biosynthesis pyrimidine reductase
VTPERRFEAFCTRKTRDACNARIPPLVTIDDASAGRGLLAVGSEWTRRMYDGAFHLTPVPDSAPAVSLVFVQSRDGNTVARTPSEFGGGDVDKHLLYEGLSRVAADAVLAGAATAGGKDVFFSVWHPELVALRSALGLPRHPAQIVVTGSGRYDLEKLLAFQVPAAPVFVLTTEAGRARLAAPAAGRPWVRVIAMGDEGMPAAFASLRSAHGVARISAIGGPRVATSLVDAGLVQDVYLTTTSIEAGARGTPFYTGASALAFDHIVVKQGDGERGPIIFQHSWIRCGPTAPPSPA